MAKGVEEVMSTGVSAGRESQGKVAAAAANNFPAGMRVLAVDDDPVCLKLLECLLRHCNYRPTAVAHAETALKMLREGEEQFDLVISDVHMPGMDGFELLEHIGLEMDLPVIMLSANGEAETVMKGIAQGACDYLVKPVRIKELKNIWQHVVRRKPEIRSHIDGDNDNDSAAQEVQSRNVEENGSMNHAGNANSVQEVQSRTDEGDQSSENSTKKHSGNEGNGNADQEVQPRTDEGDRSSENSTKKHSGNEGNGNAADQQVQLRNDEVEQNGESSAMRHSRNGRNGVDGSDRNKENSGVSARKKRRITWTCPLHRKFVEVVNQIGVDRAVPKKILDMMNVENITRENVASHLQKYRLYLKKAGTCKTKRPDLLADSCQRWSSVFSNKKELSISNNYYGQGRHLPNPTVASSNSSNLFARMNSPSALAAYGLLTTQSTPVSYAQSKLSIRTVGHGGSLLKNDVPESLEDLLNGRSSNVRNCFSSCNTLSKSLNGMPSDAGKDFPSSLSGKSFADRPDVLLLDASKSFPSNHSSKNYARILRGKLLDASKGIPSSPFDSCFENMPNGSALEPANQFPMQPPELGNFSRVQMNSFSTEIFSTIAGNASQFPNPGNSEQIVVPSKFPDLHKNMAYLGLPQANIPKNSQITSFDVSSHQIPTFENELQNQMTTIMSNAAAMAGFNEQMAPFNLGSNAGSTEMQNNNFALGNDSNISSAFPNIQMGSSVMPDEMLNGGGACGIPSMHGGTVDQQAVDDQLIFSNATNGTKGSGDLDDIFPDYLNQDFTLDDDAFIMDEGWDLVP